MGKIRSTVGSRPKRNHENPSVLREQRWAAYRAEQRHHICSGTGGVGELREGHRITEGKDRGGL